MNTYQMKEKWLKTLQPLVFLNAHLMTIHVSQGLDSSHMKFQMEKIVSQDIKSTDVIGIALKVFHVLIMIFSC